jgi:hypothetical protein
MEAANEYTFPTWTDRGNGVAPHRPSVRSRSSASERITNSPDALSPFFWPGLAGSSRQHLPAGGTPV